MDEARGLYPPIVAHRRVRAPRPSVQLLAPPPAENRERFEQPVGEGEHLVLGERLRGRALSEVRPAHVHVQAARPRVVAPHARGLGRLAYRAPELLALRRQEHGRAHRVRDEFGTVLEARVPLEVEVVAPCEREDAPRRPFRRAPVHLQFDSQCERARFLPLGAMEYRLRLVRVGVDEPAPSPRGAPPAEALVRVLSLFEVVCGEVLPALRARVPVVPARRADGPAVGVHEEVGRGPLVQPSALAAGVAEAFGAPAAEGPARRRAARVRRRHGVDVQ